MVHNHLHNICLCGSFCAFGMAMSAIHMHKECQQTWEHPAALSEGFSYGAEAQDDMQVGAHTLQEEGIQGVCSLPCTLCLCSRPDLIQHTNQLILGEQIRDLSCSNCPSCAWFGSQVKVTNQARLHLVCQERVQAIVSLAVPTGLVWPARVQLLYACSIYCTQCLSSQTCT